MMKQIKFLLISTLMTLAMMGCGLSPEEREQRRENAFDIQGKYELSIPSSETYTNNTKLEIQNETDRSNVLGIIDRDDFTNSEIKAFNNANISLNDVEKFRTHFIIGKGKNNRILGGENISYDMGNTSNLYLTTNYNELLNIDDKIVEYSIIGSIAKNDFKLKGKINLTIYQIIKTTNSSESKTLASVDIPFTSKTQNKLYKQYMGTWSGSMLTDDQVLNQSFSALTFDQVTDSYFSISSTHPQFYYEGENFKILNQNRPLNDLTKKQSPDINVEYVGSNGSKLVISGTIYSLGLFTGVIYKIDSIANTTQLGSFKFKRY